VGEKALWPTVAIVGILGAVVSALFLIGVDPVAILAVLSFVVTNVITLMLYGKIQKIETNTNGSVTEYQELIRDLVNHAKRTVPIETVQVLKTDVES
jgi:hypothetical protein